jgi:putative membrane protein
MKDETRHYFKHQRPGNDPERIMPGEHGAYREICKEAVMNKNIKTALIIGGVIVAILIIVPLIFGLIGGWRGYGYGYGMMGPWMMGEYGGWWFMLIIMVIFWGLVVWGIVALVRGLSTGGNTSDQTDSALEILKRRYARGEITKQEF